LGAVFAQTTGSDPCQETEFDCVGEGDSCTQGTDCGRDGNDPCPVCEDSACLTGTCRALATKGEPCSNSAGPVCTDSDGEEPHVNTCVGPDNLCGTSDRPFYAGDPCADDDPWITTPSADGGCANGVCTSGFCEEFGSGDNCTSALQCAQGLTCIEGECAAWKTSGNCTTDFDCAPSHVCHAPTPTAAHTCTAINSIAAGGNADCAVTGPLQKLEALASSVCAAGTACIAGKCESIDDKTGDSCDTTADCNAGNPPNSFSCVDNICTDSSTCIPLVSWVDADVSSAYKAYRQCLTNSNCNRLSLPWSSNAGENCAEEHCREEYNDLVDAWGRDEGVCGSASGLIPVVFVALVAALLALF